MIQRFLLNRVNAKPRGPTIRSQYNFTISSFPNKTKSPLTIVQSAMPGTNITSDTPVIKLSMKLASNDKRLYFLTHPFHKSIYSHQRQFSNPRPKPSPFFSIEYTIIHRYQNPQIKRAMRVFLFEFIKTIRILFLMGARVRSIELTLILNC